MVYQTRKLNMLKKPFFVFHFSARYFPNLGPTEPRKWE